MISIAGSVKSGEILAIERRLYQQLIVGKQKTRSMFDEFDADLEPDANKLDVERDAIYDRMTKQIQARELFEAVSTQLTNTVCSSMENQLASPAQALEFSQVNEQQILMLDLLQSKSLDLNRLRPLISNQSWLARDLLNMVNSPSFRNKAPQGSDVKVTDIKLVLNYIGVENLRKVIPYFCLRNWLPGGHANLLWTNRKLWRYSIVSAIAVLALARLHGRNPSFLYTATLLNQLGTSVILSNSARLFEKTWGTWLREASSTRDKEVYDAVMASEYPASEVLEQVLAHGETLNWKLLHLLDFNKSKLARLQFELDQTMAFNDLSFDAKLIAKARCYAKVLLLEEMRQIEPQEKKRMFDYYEFSEQELLRLKGQNYRKLDLV